MRRRVLIGGSYLVPLIFRILGSFGVFLICYYVFQHNSELIFILTGIAVSPVIIALWVSRRVREIDLDEEYMRDFIFVLGTKWGPRKNLRGPVYLKLCQSGDGYYHVLQLVKAEEKLMLLWDQRPEIAMKKARTVAKKLELALEVDLPDDV